VVGVHVKSSNSIDGWDSVLSILQMPNGIPVATVALNAAKNAAILAASILAVSDKSLASALEKYKRGMETEVLKKADRLRKSEWPNAFDGEGPAVRGGS
jgi:5-(carboxyamino)imidazole ribonucleotide mutase